MKRILIAMIALLTINISASAMSYEQARQQALFLTDKMAYELNLTEEQYEAAYEVNLDYLMSVNTQADLYGVYWTQRNMDLSYILLDWQYEAYLAARYFYRPLYWEAGYWHFGIYARYPYRDFFYFGRPHFWTVYPDTACATDMTAVTTDTMADMEATVAIMATAVAVAAAPAVTSAMATVAMAATTADVPATAASRTAATTAASAMATLPPAPIPAACATTPATRA